MLDADLVEGVESSVVSKSLKAQNLDASMLLDVQQDQLGFIKGRIIAVVWLSLSWTLNRGQLNHDC
ncbi:DUF645 family protein, partial [Vibrio cholerae]|nr:DUF645 family protein [Vibrio cholerae]